ncbi:MAG: hypothetical protein PUE80_04090, partial [bacterium]|nr:hypothetical protein [bacterium]
REAAFSSGGEGCEWGAKQPTVGASGDKAENEFSGFIPLVVPRKGFSPHIPATRLFVLFHPSKPHQIKQPLSKRAVTPPSSVLSLTTVESRPHTQKNIFSLFFNVFFLRNGGKNCKK